MRRCLWAVGAIFAVVSGLVSCTEDKVTETRDTEYPSTRILYPPTTAENPMDVSEAVDIYVAATDNVGVSHVELWSQDLKNQPTPERIGDALSEPIDISEVPEPLRPTDGSQVYLWHWSTTSIRNGTDVRLFTRAYDAAGNHTRSDPAQVRIINSQDRRAPRPTIVVVDPVNGQGTTEDTFLFDASLTEDDVYGPDRIQVRWDFESDGLWDEDWDKNLVAADQVTWRFARTGNYIVTVEAKNDYLPDATGRNTASVGVSNVGGELDPPEPWNYRLVPAGIYHVGADSASQPHSSQNERPMHETRLTSGFYLERTEVTNRLFLGFLRDRMAGEQPLVRREGRVLMLYPDQVEPVESDSLPQKLLVMDDSDIYYDTDADSMSVLPELMDQPVVGVSWYGAKAYAENYGCRLPTEHEWEIAAKGDSADFSYPWGREITTTQANYLDSGWNSLRPRGSYPADSSMFGLLDVVGNASEWTKDWYDAYSSGLQTNPEGPISGDLRVVRGGHFRKSADGVRVTAREAFDPTETSRMRGFRTAYTAP